MIITGRLGAKQKDWRREHILGKCSWNSDRACGTPHSHVPGNFDLEYLSAYFVVNYEVQF